MCIAPYTFINSDAQHLVVCLCVNAGLDTLLAPNYIFMLLTFCEYNISNRLQNIPLNSAALNIST